MQADSSRGNYNLKETSLAPALIAACGLLKSSSSAQAAINWRSCNSGNRGNFAAVMEEVLS